MKRWYNDKLLNKGDTVYVLPELMGNYMYEDNNGKITTFFGNAPKTYVDGKGKRHDFRYNISK